MESIGLMNVITYPSGGAPKMVFNRETKAAVVHLTANSTSPISEISVSSYYWMTCKGTVGVQKSNWYFEVKLQKVGKGACRIGWCTDKYIGDDGLGIDEHSWSIDGAQRKFYKSVEGTKYGENWTRGDIIGCQLDFDQKRITYYRNGKSLGVAFGSLRVANALLYPAISLTQDATVSVNFGKFFSHLPFGCYGLNSTLTEAQRKSLNAVFDQYSGGADIISDEGLLHLATYLGSTGPMDPTLLLVAWILFSSQQWEFAREEWTVSWSLQGVYEAKDIKSQFDKWRTTTLQDKSTPLFKNFYQFVFEYLKVPKSSHMEKSEALVAWKILGIEDLWGLFPKWEKYLEGHSTKIVPRDTWNMLIRFIEKMGTQLDNYDENDSWPLFIDEFVKEVTKN